MKNYLAVKRKGIWAHATTRMNFEDIVLNEKQGAKGHPLSMPHSTGVRSWGRQIPRDRKWKDLPGAGELVFNTDRVSVSQGEKSFTTRRKY